MSLNYINGGAWVFRHGSRTATGRALIGLAALVLVCLLVPVLGGGVPQRARASQLTPVLQSVPSPPRW